MSRYCQPVIGYLVKTFPKVSETFILNEILELERQGLNLHIFSLRSPTDKRPHPAVAQIKSPITYIPSLLPEATPQATLELVEAQQELLREAPQAFLRALECFAQGPETREVNELWQAVYLAREIQRLQIVHLHVHFANVPAATAELAQQICWFPFSITAHAKDIYLTEPAVLDRRMAKAEFVLTCTDFNRCYLTDLSTSDTPIYLAYHGIDLNRFMPFPCPKRPEPVQLLSVGRFCEKKGFSYLLQACRLLQERGILFHCAIVGYGPLQTQMEEWIRDYQLDSVVTLVGQLTQDQLIERYCQADLFVLPCVVTEDGDRDGIPNVLLEAMAMGLPVVSTNVSGIGELVQSGENGLLVPERDALALADALETLITDLKGRSRLAQSGQHTVRQRFTLPQNVGEVKAHLLHALGQGNSPQPGWQTSLPSHLPIPLLPPIPHPSTLLPTPQEVPPQ
ncbi:MAG: glycosyltransferase [Synechococcales bacterium]|nr:glycosyltransferase [Synechococcales bacterium]